MEVPGRNNKLVYKGILLVLALCLLLDYVPGMSVCATWVTPPVALFLGLVFALAGHQHRFVGLHSLVIRAMLCPGGGGADTHSRRKVQSAGQA